jgi:hypothetical protein
MTQSVSFAQAAAVDAYFLVGDNRTSGRLRSNSGTLARRQRMSRQIASAAFVALALAVAIHADWHFARPTHHRLSLGLPWHWILAIPVFALAAVYVARTSASRVRQASLAILGTAIVTAGILEPLWEYTLGGATLEWAFGAQRNIALAAFVVTGLMTYAAVLALLLRTKRVSPAGSVH